MSKQHLEGMWDRLRQRHGIALRVVELYPEDRITDTAIPGMRTPAQQVAHMYGLVKDISEGVASGTITHSAQSATDDAGIKSKADMIAYMNDCWSKANAAVSGLSDDKLTGNVDNPWGMELQGSIAFAILYDEFMHHRGQLYTFARVFGQEPPMMWDFGNNAPEYQPQAAQTS